jgi:hypothetical protein
MGSPETTTGAGTGTSALLVRSWRRAVLFALAGLVACTVALSLWRNLGPISSDGYRALTGPGHSVVDGDLDPLAYFVSTRALSGARAVIPPHESYTVVVGTTTPPLSALPGPLLKIDPVNVRDAFRLWLMPRPYVPQSKADWIVAYDTSVSSLGVKAAQTITLDADATLVRVAGK